MAKNIFLRVENNQVLDFENHKPLKNIKIGIVNYDKGNQIA